MNFPPSPRTTLLALTLATALPIACQEVDDSAPSHPRTEQLLIPNAQAQDNAAKRAQEAPGPMLPGATGEIQRTPSPTPSPSAKAPTSDQPHMLTLTQTPNPSDPATPPAPPPPPPQSFDNSGKKLSYNPANYYPGPLPHLPANPGTVPMTGSTPIPDDPDWTIDHSWGQGIQLAETPHREWPQQSVEYKTAEVHNNPTYYFNITPLLGLQSNNSYLGDAGIATLEIPWYFLNTAIVPVEMFVQTPWSQQSSIRVSHDPIFTGYLPQAGDIIPSPIPIPDTPPSDTTQPAYGTAATTPMTMPLTMPATTPSK